MAATGMHTLRHCCFVGDVTALHLLPRCAPDSSNEHDHVAAGTLCLATGYLQVQRNEPPYAPAGMGSQLLVYELSTGMLVNNHTIFPSGIHVHGIHAVGLQDSCLLAVHGERFAKVSKCVDIQ